MTEEKSGSDDIIDNLYSRLLNHLSHDILILKFDLMAITNIEENNIIINYFMGEKTHKIINTLGYNHMFLTDTLLVLIIEFIINTEFKFIVIIYNDEKINFKIINIMGKIHLDVISYVKGYFSNVIKSIIKRK
jgi:hypothetical protein